MSPSKIPTLYLLSGLGADKRVFEFLDLSGYQYHHIEWVAPHEKESIETYATRLSRQITTPRPILIGVSFGGMMAIEISRQIDTALLIAISAARDPADVPKVFRFLGKLGFHKILPTTVLKTVTPFTYWLFGTKSAQQRVLLREIIKGTDPKFLKWAVDKILLWKTAFTPKNMVTIHGDSDRILPSRKPDFVIKGGGHLMIVDKHQEITAVLRIILKKLQGD